MLLRVMVKAERAESESTPPPACQVVNRGTFALEVRGSAGGLRCSFSLCPAGEACRMTLIAALARRPLALCHLTRFLSDRLPGQETFELLPVSADVFLLTVALYILA